MTQTHTAGVDAAHVAERIAHGLRRSNTTVAAAESVTGGNIATHLAAAQGAGDWFRGALTAYSEEAKFAVLNVKPGPVITADCARQMAIGVAQLLKAALRSAPPERAAPDLKKINPRARSSSPSPLPTSCEVTEYHFQGGPETVVHESTIQALHDLAAVTGVKCRSMSVARVEDGPRD
jgi:nicotinamide-nucleotide amidase